MGSQTLGVRVPDQVLASIDKFAEANDMTRSKAISALVERALMIGSRTPRSSQTERTEDGLGGQNTASGQRAQEWGKRTARKIASVLGAEKATDQPMANEYILDGKRVAIKCARSATTQCGITNTMRDRIDYIICASQTADGSFSLYKVTPDQWEKHANRPPKKNRNYNYLTHLSRSVYRRIGEDLGEVEVEE